MATVQLKQITPGSPDALIMERINNESFPESEHIDAEDMFYFNGMDIRVLGIYADEICVGFFTVIIKEDCLYICYFSISGERRGQGIGTQALRALQEMFADRQIVVDFEAFDEKDAPNPEERLRRRNFYYRNGFSATGSYMYYMEAEFEVACSRVPMDEAAYQRILDDIHDGAPEFPGKMYKRSVSC